MNHDQYEAEAVAIEQWACREKCKLNIRLNPGPWRDIAYREIDEWHRTPSEAFAALWDDTNGEGAWERNEFVWIIDFKVVGFRRIDQ